MGTFTIWHWLVVLAVVLLMFGGRGKISQLMGDFGKGLSAFKKGVSGDNPNPDQAAKTATAPGDDAKTIGQGATHDPAPATAAASSAPKEQVKT